MLKPIRKPSCEYLQLVDQTGGLIGTAKSGPKRNLETAEASPEPASKGSLGAEPP
jgi:hypothetical protein